MDNGNCLCDTPGNGKAVQEVVDDVQMVSKVTYLLVNIKGLGEQIHDMFILPLILEINLHVFREGLEITVIPYKAHLIYKQDRIFRKMGNTNINGIEVISSRYMHVAIDVPPLLTVFKCHFTHERSLATTFLAKDHKELIWIAILKEMISKKDNPKQAKAKE